MRKFASPAFCRILAVSLVCSAMFCACSKKEEPVPEQKIEQEQPKTAAQIAAEKLEQQKPKQADDNAENTAKSDEFAAKAHNHEFHDYKTIEAFRPGLEENALLTEIPDNSFYTFASCGNFQLERPDIEDFFNHISTIIMANMNQIDSKANTPYQKATAALFKGIFRSFSPQKLRSLGLMGDRSPQFAFYFVKQTPVLKIALEDGEKFRQIVESYWEQNNVETRRAENVSTQWTLVKIDDDLPMELAIRWDEHRVTMTVISDMEHAGLLLPELMMHPFEGHSGLNQLSQINFSRNAAAVGIFDFTAMLNQLVQIQATTQKLTGESNAELDRSCVKDFRRIVDNIPKMGFQVELVTGGSSMGIDLKMMIDLKISPWLKDLMNWKPKKAEFERTAEMPMAEGYISVPTPILLTGMRSIAADIKRDPFTCSSLVSLNSLADLESSQNDEVMKQLESVLTTDHHLGGIMYSSAWNSNPLIAAITYHSDNAAKVAAALDMIRSDKLNAKLAKERKDAEEEAAFAELMAKNPKLAKEKQAERDAAKAAEGESAPEQENTAFTVYDDAKLSTSSFLKDIKGISRYATYMTDTSLVVSHKTFIKQAESQNLTDASSLLHVMISEDLLANDKDNSRDYIIGLDIGTSESTLDITLRYAIK